MTDHAKETARLILKIIKMESTNGKQEEFILEAMEGLVAKSRDVEAEHCATVVEQAFKSGGFDVLAKAAGKLLRDQRKAHKHADSKGVVQQRNVEGRKIIGAMVEQLLQTKRDPPPTIGIKAVRSRRL